MPYQLSSAREIPVQYTSDWVRKMANLKEGPSRPVYSLSSSSGSWHESCRARSPPCCTAPKECALGPRQLSLEDIWKASENKSLNRAKFVDTLEEWGHHMMQDSSTFTLLDHIQWHMELLNVSHLVVCNKTSLLHLQYWAACFPNLYNMTQLLNLAVTRGI
jgi:hypothetical protein